MVTGKWSRPFILRRQELRELRLLQKEEHRNQAQLSSKHELQLEQMLRRFEQETSVSALGGGRRGPGDQSLGLPSSAGCGWEPHPKVTQSTSRGSRLCEHNAATLQGWWSSLPFVVEKVETQRG
jgi:hypothetical protein